MKCIMKQIISQPSFILIWNFVMRIQAAVKRHKVSPSKTQPLRKFKSLWHYVIKMYQSWWMMIALTLIDWALVASIIIIKFLMKQIKLCKIHNKVSSIARSFKIKTRRVNIVWCRLRWNKITTEDHRRSGNWIWIKWMVPLHHLISSQEWVMVKTFSETKFLHRYLVFLKSCLQNESRSYLITRRGCLTSTPNTVLTQTKSTAEEAAKRKWSTLVMVRKTRENLQALTSLDNSQALVMTRSIIIINGWSYSRRKNAIGWKLKKTKPTNIERRNREFIIIIVQRVQPKNIVHLSWWCIRFRSIQICTHQMRTSQLRRFQRHKRRHRLEWKKASLVKWIILHWKTVWLCMNTNCWEAKMV